MADTISNSVPASTSITFSGGVFLAGFFTVILN